MATKKHMTTEAPRTDKRKSDDAVVYKVMIALLVLCAAVLGLRTLRSFYITTEGFSTLYDLTPMIAVGGLAVAAVSALLLLWKNKVVRLAAPWLLVLGLLTAVTGWIMRTYDIEKGFPFLYFLCVAVLAQYVILQLYRWEFFLFSLSTVTAGGLFYCFSQGMYFTGRNIAMLAALALVILGTSVCIRMAGKNGGWLALGSAKLHLLNAKSLPVLIFAVNALWLICTVAMLLLGSLFAYYCMFAAIAVEFIAAVYYTFQLN